MIDAVLKLQKPLEDYIEALENVSPRSATLLEPLVDIDFIFQDPYHKAQGFEGVKSILLGRLGVFKNGKYHISDFIWGRRNITAYLYWRYSYHGRKKLLKQHNDNSISIEGMSELVFSGNGKILTHTDFWGEHSHVDVKAYKSIQL